ncbi:MAG: diacylglycerol/lipid kinase family protein [Spirosomataceae bacterium]
MNQEINKLLLITNPVSGDGKNLKQLEKIGKILQNWQITSVISQYKGFIADYLENTKLEEFDVIGLIGGDGTLHEAINGLKNKIEIAPPIILFPCGTGNAFNSDIQCSDIATAIKNLNRGKIQEIDIFELTDSTKSKYYFFNNAGWGLVSNINVTAEKLRFLGGIRYSIAALIHIFKNPKFNAKVKIDNQIIEQEFCFVLACNSIHTGKDMKIAPLADMSDGLLDVLVIKHLSIFNLLKLFPLIFSGKHIHSKLVNYIKATSVDVDAKPLNLIIDGEIKASTPFSIEIYKQKLKMIV